jgi:phage terminase large subunit-like protein
VSSLALRTAAKAQAWYDKWVDRIPKPQTQGIHASWRLWGRSQQKAPPGDWRNWMIMAGRGFGKTRAGAEWVHALAMAGDGDTRIALVGATADEARHVMVEGQSGLLSVGLTEERPRFEPSLMRLVVEVVERVGASFSGSIDAWRVASAVFVRTRFAEAADGKRSAQVEHRVRVLAL